MGEFGVRVAPIHGASVFGTRAMCRRRKVSYVSCYNHRRINDLEVTTGSHEKG